jgi:hypothetical protein
VDVEQAIALRNITRDSWSLLRAAFQQVRTLRLETRVLF